MDVVAGIIVGGGGSQEVVNIKDFYADEVKEKEAQEEGKGRKKMSDTHR